MMNQLYSQVCSGNFDFEKNDPFLIDFTELQLEHLQVNLSPHVGHLFQSIDSPQLGQSC